MNDQLVIERQGMVAVLRLNAIESRNALSHEMKQAFIERLPEVLNNDSVRCLLITGVGSSFCAGGDLRTMHGDRSWKAVEARMVRNHQWLTMLLDCDKPIVTAVNGAAVGAGLALALLGDLIIAGKSAYFAGGFSKVGAAPDMAAAYTLTRAIGAQRAKDVLLTGRRIEAEEALSFGMVNRVTSDEDLESDAMELAAQLALGPAQSMHLTKSLIQSAFQSQQEFLDLEVESVAAAFGSDDFAEGVDAFLNKRKPQFTHNGK